MVYVRYPACGNHASRRRTAPPVDAAWAAFEELEEKWGKPYPAIPKLWRAAWEEFTPFHRAGTMDHAVGTRTERIRRHLRRPHAGRREPLMR
jgi:transposase-like protein